jgi:type III pantothenate kinase
MAKILALDRGNYALKAALLESAAVSRRWGENASHPERTIRRVLEECTPSGVVLSSVVPAWTMGVLRVLAKLDVGPVVVVNAAVKLPFELRVDAPEKLGPDRICAAAGVYAAGEREAVIVDAGTAVTVDVLSRDGFMGGAIFPGESLLSRALHEGTSALPPVDTTRGQPRLPGRNTDEAIFSGVRWGLIGAVKELIAQSKASLPLYASVWLTGGGAQAIAPHLDMAVKHEPDLLFLGMNLLFSMNAAVRRHPGAD